MHELDSEHSDLERNESGENNDRKKKINQHMCMAECIGKKIGIVSISEGTIFL